MNRKKFILQTSTICIGGLGAILLKSCLPLHYAVYTENNNELVIKETEFMELKNGKSIERKFVLVQKENMGFPICIYKTDEKKYVAIYTECTHKGCAVKPQNEIMVCPCHGSEFDITGKVLSPPAEIDLKSFPLRVENNTIYIKINP